MGVFAFLGRAAGFARGVLTYLPNVNLKEIGEAGVAFATLRTAASECDYENDDEIGDLIDKGGVALQQAADVTKTPVDDDLAAAIVHMATSQRAFLIAAIKFFVANPDADVIALRSALADPTIPAGALGFSASREFWFQLAAELWAIIRAARQKA